VNGHNLASSSKAVERHRVVSLLTLLDLPCSILAGVVLLTIIIVSALGAPWIAHHNPTEQHPQERLQPPSGVHWFGTDRFGRDTFSRILYGARISLATGSLGLVLVVSIGLAVGLLAGYAGSWVDAVAMRLVDALFAFPAVVPALVIVGLFGPGLINALLALVSVWWVSIARVVRGIVLQIKQEPYVEAAQALGASPLRIVWRHILPGVLGPMLPLASFELGNLILSISSLSFLGLGIQPPSPEWGAMLADGRSHFAEAPYLIVFPGLMIFLTILALNLIGEGLRDILDPTSTSIVK